jgi:hypothetical protein
VDLNAIGQRAVRLDEARDRGFVVGLAELREQVAQVMYGSFHDILLIPFGIASARPPRHGN